MWGGKSQRFTPRVATFDVHQAAVVAGGSCLSLCARARSFVLKHHVFLVRNWELVRDKQIRLRLERERDEEGEERASRRPSCDGSVGDDGHIKSGP